MMKKDGGFQVPDEMRTMLEQGVRQAREGFDKMMAAAGEAVETLEAKSGAAQADMAEIKKKSLAFTETSIASAFDFAQKLVSAKSMDEFMRHQAEYMRQQYETVREHVQEAGQEIQRRTKAATAEMAAEAEKLQQRAREAAEQGVEAVKKATKPKK
ncbi:MAG TPA: phasin family protein [Rhabdaerophilum sp.]|nr:phasin family protein [Rhabdaerophilum sp.]